MAVPFRIGATAIVVVVPEAEPAVNRLRAQYDVAAAWGAPAHVTVLYPWLPSSAVTPEAVQALAELGSSIAPFEAHLARVGRFPGTVWLEPSPSERFAELTRAVWRRWPESPPYAGQFDAVVPHLTVADAQPEPVLRAAEQEVSAFLPIAFRVDALSLLRFDGSSWALQENLRLTGP